MMGMLGPGGVVVVVKGRMMRTLGPGLGGGSGGGAGGWEVVALPSFLAWLGAGAPLFRLARLGGIGGGGAGGAWGWKKGCVACWPGSLSGGCAGVCMVAFAWLRVRSASLRTVSGGSVGHGSAAGLLSKGMWHRQRELDQGNSAPDKLEGHTMELNSAHPIRLLTAENKAHRGTKYTGELPPEWSEGLLPPRLPKRPPPGKKSPGPNPPP